MKMPSTKRSRRGRGAAEEAAPSRSSTRSAGSPRKGLRLLVAVDFSPDSDRALRAAANLARTTGASATVVHVRPISELRALVEQDRGDLVRRPPATRRRGLAAHYEARLDQACKAVPGSRSRLLRGWPAGAIAREAAKAYDLVVIGQRGSGVVRKALLGSTAEEVLHRSPVPVLLVSSGPV